MLHVALATLMRRSITSAASVRAALQTGSYTERSGGGHLVGTGCYFIQHVYGVCELFDSLPGLGWRRDAVVPATSATQEAKYLIRESGSRPDRGPERADSRADSELSSRFGSRAADQNATYNRVAVEVV